MCAPAQKAVHLFLGSEHPPPTPAAILRWNRPVGTILDSQVDVTVHLTTALDGLLQESMGKQTAIMTRME